MSSSAQVSPFVDDDYVADRDIVKHYHNQASLLLSKIYNKSEEEVKPLVQEIFIPDYNGFREANFFVFEKDKYGDRQQTVKKAREFFKTVEDNNYHLSPSFVAYKHSDEEQSVNSIGTEKFLKDRSFYKGKMQEARERGDDYQRKAFNEIQNALKIFNNAQSGAMSSNGTPLNNKSGHTTLTSTCRALTSTANIINERLLTGNRLFINYEKTMEYMLSLLACTNLKRLDKVIKQLNMNYATTDQVMDMLKRCSSYYWNNEEQSNILNHFVSELLSPLERTAVLCIMDLNGLYTTNSKIVTEFLDDWCKTPTPPKGSKEDEYQKPANGDYYILCVSKLLDDVSKVGVNYLNEYHLKVEEKWKDFIEVFFKARIPPNGVFSIKEMIRESVLTSDTDSSIYTVDEVIDKYTQDPTTALRLNGVLTYFIRMLSVHQHAQLSKNMNVSNKNLGRLTMKNEYLFGSYVTTLMSKHYFATQLMVEGVMNKEVKMEIKGVHLRSSKVAKQIKDFAHQLMRDILDAVYEKRKLDAATILHQVAELERQIISDIEGGSPVWLGRATINNKEMYKDHETKITAYYYHELWNNVFGPKYGKAPPPPYSVIKINTTTTSKRKLEDYYDVLTDKDFKERLQTFLGDRDKLNAFYVPEDMIERLKGVPREMILGSDIRSIISQNLKSIYAVLETMGIYIMNKDVTKLVSDEH